MRSVASLWPQWLAVFEMFLLALQIGINVGWTTPFMGKLMRPNPPFVVTKEETSWVASLTSFSRPVGIIIGSSASSFLGAKRASYLSGLSFLIGSVCLFVADSIKIMFGYFICGGIGFGILDCTNPVFTGEIADVKIRGGLASFVIQGLLVGTLLGNIMGSYLEQKTFAIINMVIALFFLTTFYFFPDTPLYLLRQGKKEEAYRSIKWYNRNVNARKEVESLQKFLLANPSVSISETLNKMNSSVNRKIISMVIGLVFLQNLTGIMTLRYYFEILFSAGNVTVTSPSFMVILMTIFSIIVCSISIYVINKVERRTTMSVACGTLTLSYCCWGFSYHLIDLGYVDPNLQWIIILSAALYRLCVCMAMYPMTSILMSELFAPDIKNVSVFLVTTSCSMSAFISSKFFQLMVDYLTYKYVFYIFASIASILGVYCKFLIPKTKGKSLPEIQVMLNNNCNIEELKILKDCSSI